MARDVSLKVDRCSNSDLEVTPTTTSSSSSSSSASDSESDSVATTSGFDICERVSYLFFILRKGVPSGAQTA
jgi:hypothetical protein